jgi:hypothetical protein
MEFKLGPRFSQAAIDELRKSDHYKKQNQDFESKKKAIDKKVSPKDTAPLIKAGANREKLLKLLALVATSSRQSDPKIMIRREELATLANNLEALADQAARLSCDPTSDGRFWLALELELSWDSVPQSGIIEAPTIMKMRALALLFKRRGEEMGKLSRKIGLLLHNKNMKLLMGYIRSATGGKQFDREVAQLLMSAFTAIGQSRKTFTPDQIKKFRQRHLHSQAAEPKTPTKRKSLGQRIAE